MCQSSLELLFTEGAHKACLPDDSFNRSQLLIFSQAPDSQISKSIGFNGPMGPTRVSSPRYEQDKIRNAQGGTSSKVYIYNDFVRKSQRELLHLSC